MSTDDKFEDHLTGENELQTYTVVGETSTFGEDRSAVRVWSHCVEAYSVEDAIASATNHYRCADTRVIIHFVFGGSQFELNWERDKETKEFYKELEERRGDHTVAMRAMRVLNWAASYGLSAAQALVLVQEVEDLAGGSYEIYSGWCIDILRRRGQPSIPVGTGSRSRVA